GDDENDRAAADHVVAEIERGGDVGAAPLRRMKKDVADDAQDMGASLLGRNVLFDLIGEEKQPDLVPIADGREGEDAGDFGGELALALDFRAEFARGADIDGENDGELPFFAQLFDKRSAGASCDIPVDEPHLVTGRIFADFVEIHPASL